jgi:hypothetical protein
LSKQPRISNISDGIEPEMDFLQNGCLPSEKNRIGSSNRDEVQFDLVIFSLFYRVFSND